jgi:peptidoglycan/xylan/chitin deacetylase (PgdA/CDA1 family)
VELAGDAPDARGGCAGAAGPPAMTLRIGAVVRCADQVARVYDTVSSLIAAVRRPDVLAIVTDPSTPARATDWLEAFALRRRIRLVRAPLATPGSAWNLGVDALAGTDACVCVDAGDRLDREALCRLADRLHSGGAVLATSGVEYLGAAARRNFTVPLECTSSAILQDFDAVHTSSLFRRDAWIQAGRFDEALPALEHTDLWLRLLADGAFGVVIPAPLLKRTIRSDALYRRTWGLPEYRRAVATLAERHRSKVTALAGSVLEARDRALHEVTERYHGLARSEAEITAAIRHAVDMRAQLLEPVPAGARERPSLPAADRVAPFSHDWGYDRGTPIDRPFIEAFLERYAPDIRGRVLEIQEDDYTRRFGRNVNCVDVLDVDPANPKATVVGDLRSLDQIPDEAYDSIVLTQTLHVIDDMRAAVRECFRMLAPGGVLLATLPAASRVCLEYGWDDDYWRVTEAGARRLFADIFPDGTVETMTLGNAGAGAAFLFGLAREDVTATTLQTVDPYFPLVIGVRAVKATTAPALARVGTSTRVARASSAGRGVILLYHRVGAPSADPHDLSVCPETFATQLRWLIESCSVVPLDSVVSSVISGSLPHRTVAITFDDGYLDNLTTAVPLLKAARAPAAFFVTTAGLDSTNPYYFWWDQLAAAFAQRTRSAVRLSLDLPGGREVFAAGSDDECRASHRRLYASIVKLAAPARDDVMRQVAATLGEPVLDQSARRMSAGELRTLVDSSDYAVGAHTVEHLLLPAQPDETIRREIRESRAALEVCLDRRVDMFAYPFGALDARTSDVVRELGFRAAVTCADRAVNHREDPMLIPRIAATKEPLDQFVSRVERAFAWNGLERLGAAGVPD